jgi:hypothetical protein
MRKYIPTSESNPLRGTDTTLEVSQFDQTFVLAASIVVNGKEAS